MISPLVFRQRRTIRPFLLCCIPLFLWLSVNQTSLAEQDEIWVDDDYHAGTPGWNVTQFASLASALEAVAGGGTIHIHEGLYPGPFQIDKPGLHIRGVGESSGIILHGNGAVCTVSITANDIVLSHVTITGASDAGVRLDSCARAHITGCVVRGNGSRGIGIIGGCDHIIEDNEIYENQSALQAVGIHITGSARNIVLSGNRIHGHRDTLQQGTGILVERDSSAISVLGNTIYEADFGIRVTECLETVVARNQVSLCGQSGIHIQDSLYAAIRENLVEQNQGSGIMLVNQATTELARELAVVEGNLCQSNAAAGIYTRGASHVRVQGNTCRGNTLHGLALESSHITVTANSLVDNGIAGLRVYDVDPYTFAPLTSIVAHGNTLAGNGTYGLHSGMPDVVVATGNWWGTNVPEVGANVLGNILYEPCMLLSAVADPPFIRIGGVPSEVQIHVEGGGHRVIDDTPVFLQSSAGSWQNPGPLYTFEGRAHARLFSDKVPQTTIITATVHSAAVTTTLEFYDPAAYAAEIAFSLDASPDPICPGHNLTYVLNCRNTGDLPLHSVCITDWLPEGTWPLLDQSSPDAVYDQGSHTVQWQIGTLPGPGGVSLELRLHTSSSLREGDTLINSASIAAAELEPVQAKGVVDIVACPTATPLPSPTPTATSTPTPTTTPTPTAIPKKTTTPTPTVRPSPTSMSGDHGAIHGVVWADVDHDGEQGTEEPPVQGVLIELWQHPKGAQPLAMYTTGLDGGFSFDPIPVGEYRMVQTPPPGYVPRAREWLGQVEKGILLTLEWPVDAGYTIGVPHIQK